MRVLVAPDKFKASLTSGEVAAHLSDGLSSAGHVITALPLADGGDGSVDAAVAAGFRRRPISVTGAAGEQRLSSFAVRGDTAVIEVADLCGLATLPCATRLPLDASSLGLGEAVRVALDGGADTIVLALGGSASTDGGMGLLSALGFEFRDSDGTILTPAGRYLPHIATIDTERVRDLSGVRLVIAGDVTNSLIGPSGAAAIYGPQKGADPDMVRYLDDGLGHLSDSLAAAGFDRANVLARQAGAGSAGGIGFAGLVLGAEMVSGAEHFLDLLEVDRYLVDSDLVVTGEGSIDEQTGQGKLLSVLANRVGPRPLVAVAGRTTLPPTCWAQAGFAAIHTLREYTSQPTANNPELTASILTRIGHEIGRTYQ